MTSTRITRRLAAVLAADVVGYSRLMGADEAGTLARLKTLRQEIIDPKIAEFGGRIVKTTGDGMLIEFASAVDAVQHSIESQQAVRRRNAELPADQRIEFRIGINIGDVIIDGDDIFGDGVNIAARLEAVAEPGGITISEDVHRQVSGKVTAEFHDLGPRELKNIERPVRAYELRTDAQDAGAGPAAGDGAQALALPDKPSIAVLPFVNMSGDAEQEYFADGITEDIITALSRIRWFFVIARNTTFAYKGVSSNLRDVAEDLGVRYVLEGSVRRAGNRVRITAQLIDGATGNHVWAKRYDREMADIFAVQDELTETIVGAIEPELGKSEQQRARSKPPENLDAWDCCQRGLWHTYRRNREDLAEAQRLFAQALALEPEFVPALSGMAEASFFQVVEGHVESIDACLDAAVEAARRAVELDPQDAMARYALGRVHTVRREHERAIPELEAAIALNPSFAQAHYALGMALGTSGRPDEAVPHIETAIRLSPHDPYLGQFMLHIAEAYFFMRRHEEAVDWARRSLRQPNIRWSRWAILAAALGHLGRTDEAKQSVDSLIRLKPEVTVSFAATYWPISDPDSLSYFLDGLRKAGLPD